MQKEQPRGKPTDAALLPRGEGRRRCGWCVSCELSSGPTTGRSQRVADQLGYGVESVRSWVHQADIDDGGRRGVETADAARIKELEQENRELRRANAILKSASAFFAAELDRPHEVIVDFIDEQPRGVRGRAHLQARPAGGPEHLLRGQVAADRRRVRCATRC